MHIPQILSLPNSNPFLQYLGYWVTSDPYSPTALLNPFGTYRPLYFVDWNEERTFGGSDKFFSTSRALTNEIRLDFTKQFTDRWRARFGIDYKEHELNFYEVEEPWLDALASRQRFAEQWDDYGKDGIYWLDFPGDEFDDVNNDGIWEAGEAILLDYDNDGEYDGPGQRDEGEANGKWDEGEDYDDFNGDGEWNSYVEPMELAMYWQNTFEVPWMVINAGLRLDAVNYNTKIWSNPDGEYSATQPWFWSDCGLDGICPDEHGPTTKEWLKEQLDKIRRKSSQDKFFTCRFLSFSRN